MSWSYFFLDNGRWGETSTGKHFYPLRVMHYCYTLNEAIERAKGMTNGRKIEIYRRYGLPFPVAVIEPDGTVK